MTEALLRRRPRNLAREVVDILSSRIREGVLPPGDKLPTEAAIMDELSVSRTVVREAISRLQAAGLVETRHGVGTFVIGSGDGAPFRISAMQMETLQDVIAVLELRIAVETEAAGLAALRRTEANLFTLREVLDAFAQAVEDGRDAVGPDVQLHIEIARATQNQHFMDLMRMLGATLIPRARLERDRPMTPERAAYLRHVHSEHVSIVQAIERHDVEDARAAMRTHLTNSRERRRQSAVDTKR